jgi:hypothetical protein
MTSRASKVAERDSYIDPSIKSIGSRGHNTKQMHTHTHTHTQPTPTPPHPTPNTPTPTHTAYLGEAPVNRVAGVVLGRAERLAPREAEFAGAAGGVEPRHADAVPQLDRRHPGPHRHNNASTLMAGHERHFGRSRPIPVHGVHLRVVRRMRKKEKEKSGVELVSIVGGAGAGGRWMDWVSICM